MATGIHKFLANLFEQENLHRTHERVRYVQFVLSDDESGDNLADLISGKKTALFRLKPWLLSQKVPQPLVGDYMVLTDFYGEPHVVVKISKLETILYKEFNKEHAIASGIEDGDVEVWRKTKHAMIVADCESINITFDENVELEAMWFERLYPQ